MSTKRTKVTPAGFYASVADAVTAALETGKSVYGLGCTANCVFCAAFKKHVAPLLDFKAMGVVPLYVEQGVDPQVNTMFAGIALRAPVMAVFSPGAKSTLKRKGKAWNRTSMIEALAQEAAKSKPNATTLKGLATQAAAEVIAAVKARLGV